MACNFTKDNPVYLITDRTLSGLSHARMARSAISVGVRVIQLREKQLTRKELFREALALRAFTKRHGVTFIVNDYVDIALAVGADGVHLGQEDMPVEETRRIIGKKKIIGVSTHSLRQALKAQEDGADYIGFGPIFPTATKDAGAPKGLKMLREVRSHIEIPIVAIGGITQENFITVLDAGADSAAVMSAILKGDIKKNAMGFYCQIREAGSRRQAGKRGSSTGR